jgi:hypothetical protein
MMGLSNRALSTAGRTPLPLVFEALPIEMVGDLVGVTIMFRFIPSLSSGVSETETKWDKG